MLIKNLSQRILKYSRVTFNPVASKHKYSTAVRCTQPKQTTIENVLKHRGFSHTSCYASSKDNASNSDDDNTFTRDVASELQHTLLVDKLYDDIVENTMKITRAVSVSQNVIILQPYVKWGQEKNSDMKPEDQLREAETLVRSLPNSGVALSLKIPLRYFKRNIIFGSGKIAELKQLISDLCHRYSNANHPLTCIFVNKSILTYVEKHMLEKEFNLPVIDRYTIVIQILRLRATSAEARLQVALAEIPYIWTFLRNSNSGNKRSFGFSIGDARLEVLRTRERKLRQELKRIRSQRELLRNRRKKLQYTTISVVGYTNAGKTSLIKALTKEQTMKPQNCLFATLDVTAHAGLLPCKMKVIYMDTVGFISDLPTELFESFVATLEDAMLADLILQVNDISHDCWQAQRQHVTKTVNLLSQNISNTFTKDDIYKGLPPIVEVANKIDLVPQLKIDANHMYKVSAIDNTGIAELLKEIEKRILLYKGYRSITMRIPYVGSEIAWLYKNAIVVDMGHDLDNEDFSLMNVLITEPVLQQFKRYFCK